MIKSDTNLSHLGVKYKNKKKGQEILLSSLLQCYGHEMELEKGIQGAGDRRAR